MSRPENTITLEDCIIFSEYGYYAILEDGQLKGFFKEEN